MSEPLLRPNGVLVNKWNSKGQKEKSQVSRHLMIYLLECVGPDTAFYFTGRSFLFVAFPKFFLRIFPLQMLLKLRKYPCFVIVITIMGILLHFTTKNNPLANNMCPRWWVHWEFHEFVFEYKFWWSKLSITCITRNIWNETLKFLFKKKTLKVSNKIILFWSLIL